MNPREFRQLQQKRAREAAPPPSSLRTAIAIPAPPRPPPPRAAPSGPRTAQEATRLVIRNVRGDGIGDCVLLTPLVSALHQLFPEKEIEVVGPWLALQVLARWPLVSRATVVDYFDEGRAKAEGAWILDCRTYDSGPHMAYNHLGLARGLGYEGPMPPFHIDIEPVQLPFRRDGPVALLLDCADSGPWQRKRWPRFSELAKALLKEGWRVCLCGGPAEAQRFNRADWPAEVIDLQGRYSLPQFAYLAPCSDVVVANDTGPAHVAAVAGARLLSLFGPTSPAVWRPLGDRVRVVTSQLPCSPCCLRGSWTSCQPGNACMQAISVAQVMEEIYLG